MLDATLDVTFSCTQKERLHCTRHKALRHTTPQGTRGSSRRALAPRGLSLDLSLAPSLARAMSLSIIKWWMGEGDKTGVYCHKVSSRKRGESYSQKRMERAQRKVCMERDSRRVECGPFVKESVVWKALDSRHSSRGTQVEALECARHSSLSASPLLVQ